MALKAITFTKVRLENGWLSNMAPYDIKAHDLNCRTAEAFFQALRFPKGSSERRKVSMETNPMQAKKVAKAMQDKMNVVQLSSTDATLMEYTVGLKLIQHPDLLKQLQQLDDNLYIREDVTSRGLSPQRSDLFWGAALIGMNPDGKSQPHWVGVNMLGTIWDEYRDLLEEDDYDEVGLHLHVHDLKLQLEREGVL